MKRNSLFIWGSREHLLQFTDLHINIYCCVFLLMLVQILTLFFEKCAQISFN